MINLTLIYAVEHLHLPVLTNSSNNDDTDSALKTTTNVPETAGFNFPTYRSGRCCF